MTKRLERIMLLVGSCLACASCARPDALDDSASLESRIVGGSIDTEDPAVVLFDATDTNGNGGGCTATFITTTVLLTAAHCVVDDKGGPLQAPTYRVYLGADMKAARPTDWISVAETNVHPHPHFNPRTSANDVAVVVLSQAVAVTPLPLRVKPLDASLRGSTVRLVGYGSVVGKQGPNDGFGLRRTVTTTIQGFEGDRVHIGVTGKQACDGDSGGPALLSVQGVEEIIATDSESATNKNCAQGDLYQPIPSQLAFLRGFLPPSSASAGTPPDASSASPQSDAGSASAPPSSGTGAPVGVDRVGGADTASDEPPAATSSEQIDASSGCSAGAARPNARWAGLVWAASFVIAARRRVRGRRESPSRGVRGAAR